MVDETGAGKTSIILLVIVVLSVAAIAGGISYYYSQQVAKSRMTDLQQTIHAQETTIQSLKDATTTTAPTSSAAGEDLNCLLCHDLEQHKEFHVPQEIMKIDEAHNKRRRVCIDCHGPMGPPWSSDKQLTDPADIKFDRMIGTNGAFVLSNKIVHTIHQKKLDSGILSCEFCHVKPGSSEFTKPQVKSDLGRVLYCQNEGCHDNEGGNYISIHLELRPFKCTTCHTGDLVGVHKGGTGKLGTFEVVNGSRIHPKH